MPYSTNIKSRRNGTLTFYDYASGHSLEVAYEDGDFSYDNPQEDVSFILDRGSLGSPPQPVLGDDQPVSASFTAYLRDLTTTGYATLEQLVNGITPPSWVSTMGASHPVFTLTLVWTLDGTPWGETDRTVTLPYCVVRGSVKEAAGGNTLSINIKSGAVRPTVA